MVRDNTTDKTSRVKTVSNKGSYWLQSGNAKKKSCSLFVVLHSFNRENRSTRLQLWTIITNTPNIPIDGQQLNAAQMFGEEIGENG